MGPRARQRRESCIDYLQVSIDLRCNLPTYIRLLSNPTSLGLTINTPWCRRIATHVLTTQRGALI
jgi:hypothetical protein